MDEDFESSINNSKKMIELLISKGADINTINIIYLLILIENEDLELTFTN